MGITGITVYGCGQEEEKLFQRYAAYDDIPLRIVPAACSADNAVLASGHSCISVSHKTVLDSSILRALRESGVAYISTRSIGCNHIDMEAAGELGLEVGTVAYSPDSVADYTMMLILMSIRHAKPLLRRADTHDYRLCAARGRELRDMTVGVAGTGRIGQAVIQRLKGFGCRILAYDLNPQAKADYVLLDELLRQSDILTLHLPLQADTYHLLNRERLEGMKQGAYIINTGRGGLIDTEALAGVLEEGRLAGAALDVVEGEEGIFYHNWCTQKPIHNPLLLRLQQMPQAIITPHHAFYTDHALEDIVKHTLHNCMAFERGKIDEQA